MTQNERRLSRRTVLSLFGGLGLGLAHFPYSLAATPGIGGFSSEPWFATTTYNLREDLAIANEANGFLALLWEQTGCHYCQRLHDVNFQNSEIVALAQAHFHTIQLDIRGSRRFTDLHGEQKMEAEIARSLAVSTTPSMLFFDGRGEEVFRIPGYPPVPLMKSAFEYVSERAFNSLSFREWSRNRA